MHFTSTGLQSHPLPQPGGPFAYAGQIAEHNQYIEYSLETGILFFIIDSNVYDREGYQIADNDQLSSCLVCLPISEANMTVSMYGDYCDKYWLFFSNAVALLDLDLPNPLVANRKGYIIDWDDPSVPGFPNNFFANYLGGDLLSFSEIPTGYTPAAGGLNALNSRPYFRLPVSDTGGHPLKAILIDVYDDHFAGAKYLAVHSENSPYFYQITHTGVWPHAQWLSSALNPGEGLPYYNSVELTRSGNNDVLLATSLSVAGSINFNQDNLFLFTANSGFELQSVLPLNAHIGGLGGSIGDLAFSPNADYLYFGLDQPPYLGYYRISTGTFGDFASILTLAQAQAAGHSQLEVVKFNGNDALCFGGSGGLSYLTSPDDPTQSQLISNAIALSSLGKLNSATPYEDYYFLQHQQYVHTAEVATADPSCCRFIACQLGVLSYKVQGTNNWSPGSNPFEEVNGVVYFEEDLVFATGSYTVIDDLEFQFGPTVKAVIEAGAFVELNGCLWTSQCDLMWTGTHLLGTTNAQHSISQSSSNQGRFMLRNSTIEHARVAIAVGLGSNTGGGIVRAFNAVFRNNVWDVRFRPYQYINPGGDLVGNQSVFRDTYFMTDAPLNYPQLIPVVHAELREVYGVSFNRCSFINSTPYSVHMYHQRGEGIKAISSSFRLSGTNTEFDQGAANTDATSFYRLHYGIHSTGFNNNVATYLCRYQEFQECTYGIVNFQTDHIQVYENNFTLMAFSPSSDLETMIRGMYITGSTGYEVQQNYFTFDGVETGIGLGIWVDESGPYPNQIRNNTFNRLKLGIYVSNENALLSVSGNMNGLQLLCNTFVDGGTDIYRAEKTSMRHNQGGGQFSGGPIFAGNIFSFENPVCTGISGDFRNNLNQDFEVDINGIPTLIPWQLDYFCPSGVDIQIPVCDNGNGVFDAIQVTDATHSYDCGPVYPSYSGVIPPAGGGRSNEELIADLEENETEHNELLEYYHSWIDDGVTDASLQLVTNAFPSESEFVRDIMLQRFPLSDDVLRTFITKAENYDPWHLTQVFLANSPLHPRFLSQLEASEILSPFFMSLIHAAQEGQNPRHELENELSVLSAMTYHLKQELKQRWLYAWLDDEETTLPIDSMHQFASYPDHLLQSAAFELYFGNPAAASGHLASSEKWEDFQVPFALLESLRDSLPLDTLSIASTIDGLWLNEHPGVASFSLALQHAFLGSDWLPDPEMSFDKSMQAKAEKQSEQNDKSTSIAVYPNPASDRAMLTYPAEWSGNAQVLLYDVTGRQMFEQQLTGSGLFELRLGQHPRGMYVIHVVSEGKVLGQTRITLQN